MYLKTIFCCISCDGDIAKEEIALVKDITDNQDVFGDLNVESVINGYIETINTKGLSFLNQYLRELASQELSVEEQLKIVDLSLLAIYADNKIEYSEIKFFKKIRSRLSLSDEEILDKYPDIEDFLLPDINSVEDLIWDNVVFENIKFSDYSQK